MREKLVDFEKAYDFIIGYEGGYSNNPIDRGGETYKGIAKRYSKTWAGWLVIDNEKNNTKFPSCLLQNITLDHLVKKHYREKYWDPLLLDDVLFQDVANELFDIAVNLGIHRAAIFLQIALNVLNRNQKNYDDLVEDGIIGNKTLYALEKYFINDSPKFLINVINILQGNHYIEFMKKSPEQEKFARGWLERVTILK